MSMPGGNIDTLMLIYLLHMLRDGVILSYVSTTLFAHAGTLGYLACAFYPSPLALLSGRRS